MNLKYLFVFAAICTTAFSIPTTFVPGEVSTVTLALIFNTTKEITNTPAVYSSTATVSKYGTAQLLQDLFLEGVLTGATSSKGWKLVLVNSTPLITDSNPTLAFYAVNGATKVKIDPVRLGFVLAAGSSSQMNKTAFTDGNVTALTSKFYSVSSLSAVAPDGSGASYMTLRGVSTGGKKLLKITVPSATGGPSQLNSYNQITSIKMASVSGDVTFDDPSKFPHVVYGTVSFSSFVPTDISTYP